MITVSVVASGIATHITTKRVRSAVTVDAIEIDEWICAIDDCYRNSNSISIIVA